MQYLISNGKVVAKQNSDGTSDLPFFSWIESDDESIEIGATSYIDGKLIKDAESDEKKALRLLLKLSSPVDVADVALKEELLLRISDR